MVKIRLRRIGTKARPFYRLVVTPDRSARNGRFVEVIGTYNPVSQPKVIKIDEDRALHWLMLGAQPSQTAAILLNKTGVLERYLSERPAKRKEFKFLDKRTAASSVASVMDTKAPKAAPEPEPAPAPVEEVVAQAPAEAPAAEAPVEEAPVEEAAAEEVVAEAAPAEEVAAEEAPPEEPAAEAAEVKSE